MTDSSWQATAPAPRELVVRLTETQDWVDWDTVAAGARVSAILRQDTPPFTVEPVFVEADIDALVEKIRGLRHYDPPPYGREFFVSFDADVELDALRSAAEQLADASDEVERVVISLPLRGPAVLPADDPFRPFQGYIGGVDEAWAPGGTEGITSSVKGTNAWYAWRHPGGGGSDVNCVVIDRGWKEDHDDLRDGAGDPKIEKIAGKRSLDPDDMQHGTRSLGIVFASDNEQGVVGIAPHTARSMAASYLRQTNTRTWDERLAATIVKAVLELNPGDVLLIEVEAVPSDDDGLPVEVEWTVYEAIHDAYLADIIVIEPAGNGGKDLDDELDGYLDSGAIMVGAALENTPHERIAQTNFGSRVNCWAWGNRVTTCDVVSSDDPEGDSFYTHEYLGTSAASAIIAGVAVALQGAYRKDPLLPGEPYLTPDEMRARLAASSGTPAVEPGDSLLPPESHTVAQIGPMPDLQAIMFDDLGFPFPFVRDSRRDAGEIGRTLARMCPDVGIRRPGEPPVMPPAPPAPPFVDHNLAAGAPAEAYLRVRNRGKIDAKNVMLDVFVSTGAMGYSTFLWDHLVTVTIDTVPAEGEFVAVESIASLPRSTRAISVAVVIRHDRFGGGTTPGLLPPPPHLAWMDHVRSTAYRNLLRIPYRPKLLAGTTHRVQRLPARVPGDSMGGGRAVRLRMETHLPDGAFVFLEVPRRVAKRALSALETVASTHDGKATVVAIPVAREIRLPVLEVPGVVMPLAILVALPPGDDRALVRVVMDGSDAFPDGVTWQIYREETPSA